MKQEVTPYYVRKLSSEFQMRQRKNRQYSLRSFARSLDIQPPTLSAVLNRKRELPLETARRIATRLALSPLEKRQFLRSLSSQGKKSKSNSDLLRGEARLLQEERSYRVIAEWEHYAILTLLDVTDFESNPEWISGRLGIPIKRVELCLENLLESGLIALLDRQFVKCQDFVKTSDDVVSMALRQAHRENLELAKDKLESVPLDLRKYASMTVTTDLRILPKIKKMIDDFQESLLQFTLQNPGREVYQLALQLYPLTKTEANQPKGSLQ